MKTITIFFAVFFFSTGLFAQKFIQEWYIELPGLDYYSQATAILSTQNDHLLIAGPNVSATGSMFFMNTDTAGNVMWMTSSEEQYNNTAQLANRLIEDRDNNFVMVGNYASETYFTKLSPEGNVMSAHVSGTQYGYQAGYDVVQTADSGYLVSARNEIYGTGISLALRKLDSTGQFIWDTTLVHPGDSTPIVGNFARMDKIDDSTFVITGKRNYAPGSGEDLDVLLAKIRVWDDSVKMLALTIFEKEGTNEQGSDIRILPDNQGYIICGTGENEDVTNYTDGIIMRTDTAGNLVWKKSYTRALYSNTVFLRVLLDDEENLLVLAQTSAASGDVSLLKYSLDGDLLQKQHFDYLGLNETAYDMAISQNGKIFISAGTWSLGATSSLLLKVKDICPVTTPDAALADTLPNMGDDVVVTIQNSNDAWNYALIQIKGENTLSTLQGNGEILNFTISGLTNEEISEGLVVSVVEPGVDCIKYSDTLHLEFICPLETPEASLADTTPFIGEDVVVTIKNTNVAWEYKLIQINGEVTLGTSMGNGGNYNFTASGLSPDDVSQGLVVSVTQTGVNCIKYSDTLHLEFVDGIEDRYQKSLQIAPNPFHNFITITDTENNKLSGLAVFNTKGQLIFNKAIATDHQKIILSHVPKGIYFIRVTYREGTSVFRKIVKN